MVQSIGLIVELPFDDPRLAACMDVDWEVLRVDTSRRSLKASEMTCEKVFVCRH